jgi:PAS domain S-box-containing protein
MDKEYRIEMINQAAADVLGYKPSQAIGHVFWNFFSEGITVSSRQMIKNGMAKQRRSFDLCTPVLTTARELKWIGWQLVFKEGKWYATGRDITSQRKAESDLDILSFAARKSPSGIIIRDGEGKIIWINEAQEKLLGYSLNEMAGRSYDRMLIGEETDMTVYKTAVEAVHENRPYEIELKIYRKNSTPIWVHISNTPLLDEAGNIERQVGVMVDISERKKAEEQNAMLSMVASSTTSGVVINDRGGIVEWVN